MFRKLLSVHDKYSLHRLLRNMSKLECPLTATLEEVKKVKNDRNIWLIDVREPTELQETGKIPGSINIPLGEFESVFKEATNKQFRTIYGRDKPEFESQIITSCRSGKRSLVAQAILQKLGYKYVKSFDGGWMEWEKHL